jgi:hypothetical protein
MGGMNPLMEGRFNAAAHLIGYADALEAANHLCELNVSQQSPGSDLSICLPVFATVSAIRVRSPEKRIEVDIEHHNGLSGLKTVVCLRGQTTFVGAPFREQRTISAFSNTAGGLIISGKGSAQFEDLQTDDWLQVRLLHSQIGEIKRDENAVRRLIPPAERNILLEALKLFCGNATLDDLLVRAYNAKTPKRLNESAAFELHVAWLLGLFGLPTVVLGQYEHIVAPDTRVRRATVDILAANQHGKLLLVVACTLNPPKAEDLSNLRYARNILAREVFPETGVHVIPVLFTSATGCPAYDRPEDTFDLVPIVDADQMQNLLRLLREGQEALFFQFLANPSVNSLGDHSQP